MLLFMDFFFLNVATLVMVTVGSVRSKTGHHSYTRGSQRHSNTSYIWPLQFLDWFWLLRLFLMIYDDKNRQKRLTAEIQKCFRQSENSRASERTRIPCLSCSSFQSFFLSRGDVRQSKTENLKFRKEETPNQTCCQLILFEFLMRNSLLLRNLS